MSVTASTPIIRSHDSPSAAPLVRKSRNSLLDAVSAKTLSKFSNQFRELEYPEGTTLWDAGDQVHQIVFPVSGTISIRVPTRDGHGIEVSTIGHEGAVGFHDDGLPAVTQAVVQAPGQVNVRAGKR